MRAERSLCAGERGELAACGPAAEHGVERGLRAAGHAVVRRMLAAARKVSRVRVFHVKHSGPHGRWDARDAMGVRGVIGAGPRRATGAVGARDARGAGASGAAAVPVAVGVRDARGAVVAGGAAGAVVVGAATAPVAAGAREAMGVRAMGALAAAALSLACVLPGATAWAAEGDGAPGPNEVNPQQMPDSSFIYDTSIADLSSADSYLNNQTVQVVGEVVGDRINAEFDLANCWIALQAVDGSNADVPVFMARESSKAIDRYGAYGVRGTTLQVRGTFHLTCPEHDGLTDLHADHVSVVKKGEDLREPLDPHRFVPGTAMVLLGAVLIIVFYRLRESQR